MGSLRLLEAARQAGAEQFLFVSSVAVYDEVLPDRRLDEAHPTWPGGLYGAYKASIEPFLKSYHAEYGLNTSAWRPAGGVRRRSRAPQVAVARLDSHRPRRRRRIDTPAGGKITHVQDVADALTLAVGDAAVAGQFYTLVDCYMYWQTAAEHAKAISGSNAEIVDRKGSGPKNQFDTRKAIEFRPPRHPTALRRGHDGVREYVAELLKT